MASNFATFVGTTKSMAGAGIRSKAKRRKRRLSHNANGGDSKRRRLIHDVPEDNAKGSCNQEVVVFQDSAHSFLASQSNGDSSSSEADAASVFFELANSPLIGYRVSNDKMIVIRQDNNCAIHTGGIVWETSYLLAEFLHEKYGNERSLHPLGNTLEIGAGCGMLGLVLAAKGLSSKVVLTEASEVMANLKDNVDANNIVGTIDSNTQSRDDTKSQKVGIHGTIYQPACPKNRASVRQLRWDHLKTDIKAAAVVPTDASTNKSCNELEPHSFDTIVGTDVVFSPSLVCPLLKTIKKMARKQSKTKSSKGKDRMTQQSPTLIYLCLQVRCPDSHALLFSEAPNFGLEVVDISDELKTSKCSWGLELECVILKIKVLRSVNDF